MSFLITHQTEISANIVLLCRYLRQKGFSISANEEAESMKALSIFPITNREQFKLILKSILVKNQYQFNLFNDYYEEFWEQLAMASNSKLKDLEEPKSKTSKTQKKLDQFEALKDWFNLSPMVDEISVTSYSTIEVLTKKNFQDLSEDETKLIIRILERLAKKVAHRKSLLCRPSKKKKLLNLKRTIRAGMRRGGEIERLVYSQKKYKKLNLILLCDVSKSMDLYSRFFTHFIYAFQNSYDKIETFVFSTALHRVTTILDNLEFEKAFDTISERVPHWSGGTTIGRCLKTFTEDFGYSLLNKNAIIIIVSDGWDTGNPEMMKDAMKMLHKKSRKLIWLNPLAGSRQFSPMAIGMQTALPYIDTLLSAHNLESLRFALHQIGKRRNIQKKEWSVQGHDRNMGR